TQNSPSSCPNSRCVFDTDLPGSRITTNSSKNSPGSARGLRPISPAPETAIVSPVLKCNTNRAVGFGKDVDDGSGEATTSDSAGTGASDRGDPMTCGSGGRENTP